MKMKRSTTTRVLALCLCCGLLAGALTGCSVGENKAAEETVALHVLVVSPYVDNDALTAFAKELETLLPEYSAEGKTIQVQGVSTGTGDSDPMMTVGAMTQVAGLMASGECDVMITDPENAARYARTEAFEPLADLQGLDGTEGLGISFAQVDDDGNETGEQTPVCGVDLSGHSTLSGLVGPEIGAYITAGNPHSEAAVALVNALIAQGK